MGLLTKKQIADDLRNAKPLKATGGGIAKIIGWNESALKKNIKGHESTGTCKGQQTAFRLFNNAIRPDNK